MHAYNRMEADGSDSIAVCATKDEWSSMLMDLRAGRDWFDLEDESEILFDLLKNLGVQ